MQATPDLQLQTGQIIPTFWETADPDTPMPLQQFWAYAEAMRQFGATTGQITIFIDGQPAAFALQGARTAFRFIKISTILRGPVWLNPDPPASLVSDVYRALRKRHSPWRWQFGFIQPELANTPATIASLKKAGLRQVMTGYTTAWLDLRPTPAEIRANFNSKWRNQLAKSEKAGLSLSVGGKKKQQYAWLLAKETGQRQDKGYQALPLGFADAYADVTEKQMPGHPALLSVTAMRGREKIAGALFLLHGNSATYHHGWNGENGRAINAQNLVMWHGIQALKEKGTQFLDLGGLETQTQAGIARFKLGLGADPITYAGTWI